MCNTVKNMLVVLPCAKGHLVALRLNVEIKFNGKTTESSLDCEGGLKKVHERFASTHGPGLAKVLGWGWENKTPLLSAFNIGQQVFVAFPFKKSKDNPRTLFTPRWFHLSRTSSKARYKATSKSDSNLENETIEYFKMSTQDRFARESGGVKGDVGTRID
ncbi:hypothetical protein EK21DRAFT_94605 [Setomelanomma holmii]|uniref:Uncharacterized protein n=1 Tax=Setomelanomma holmii TaxID=210430 RepID=A0A9P4LEX6_9PLEO|nr:hypothetical protein EK21DRAFT_94605 [Setomelanomma holmii]